MPGLDLSQISSNWKKLQETLRGTQQTRKQRVDEDSVGTSVTNGAKRKRSSRSEAKSSANGYKRMKITGGDKHHRKSAGRIKQSKMGLSNSKSLLGDHDISHSDIVATRGAVADSIDALHTTRTPSKIYNDNRRDIGSTISQFQSQTDKPNMGHHPTHRAGKYVALDCEMVGTGAPPYYSDHVLARASLVNYHGEALYDSYVLPQANIPIRDYRTPYSGIRPEHLLASNGARPFAQVQRDVSTLLKGRVLVGHAVKNDLQVLVLQHPIADVRDTSRFGKWRELAGGRAPRLKDLAERELGWTIQREDSGEGHSSLEDARASMALFRKVKAELEEEVRRKVGSGVAARGNGAKTGRRVEVRNRREESDGRGEDDLDAGWGSMDDGEDGDEAEEDDEDEDGDTEQTLKKTNRVRAKKKRKTKKRTKRK